MKSILTFALIINGCLILLAQTKHSEKIDRANKLLTENKSAIALEILRPVLDQEDNPVLQAEAFRLSGLAHMMERNFNEALPLLEKGLWLNQLIHNQVGVSQSLYLISRSQAFTGRFDEALQNARKGAFIAMINEDAELEAQLLNIMSWANFETQVDFDDILLHEGRLMAVVGKIENEMKKADVYNNLGYDLTIAGIVELDSVIDLMSFANDVYAKHEKNKGRWYTLMNLTWQYRLKGEFDKSIYYGELSVAQATIENDRHAIIESSFQLGESLIEAGRLREAAQYYELANKWAGDKVDRDRYVSDVYYAHYLWESGKRREATEILLGAIAFLTTSEVFYEMHGRALLATYWLELGEIERADEMLKAIENPRHNYVAYETRFMAACTRAKVLLKQDKKSIADAVMNSWMDEAAQLHYMQMVSYGKNTIE